ncbi:granzyme B(G,H)-like [Gadus macrocephalus]|uniref:granzyme B(G,H)-like n=1 Tax=Gadus macrocephalus TaxID=80720 RepID=UPI0028CB9D30|nr:granzyme B(G,H)-like [Gadus macrocephalus]
MALNNTWVVLMLVLSLRGQVQTGKIIGGRPAVAHSRPYMVLLEREMWKNETKYCDGFLISDEFVVTAAHCEARIYYVYVGLHKFINDQTPKGITVRRAIPHGDFKKITRDNDLMLLQLSEKVNITENVRPINLASRRDHLLPQRCIVSGWGFTNEYQELASELMEVNLTLAKDTSCPKPQAFFSLGEIGPSHGDSGGPLVCEGEVAYGVVLHGKRSCPPYKYKVFTKIPDYLDWIVSHLMQK